MKITAKGKNEIIYYALKGLYYYPTHIAEEDRTRSALKNIGLVFVSNENGKKKVEQIQLFKSEKSTLDYTSSIEKILANNKSNALRSFALNMRLMHQAGALDREAVVNITRFFIKESRLSKEEVAGLVGDINSKLSNPKRFVILNNIDINENEISTEREDEQSLKF